MLKFIEKHGLSFSKRAAATVLCMILLVTAFSGIPFFKVNAGQVEYYSYINNYYPLKGGYANAEFYKDSDWSFEGRNFMETADFETSSENFAAPEADVAVDGSSVSLSWQPVDMVAKYEVNVFKGTDRIDASCKIVTETSAALDGLETDTRYAVQICAFDAKGSLLSASTVREFVTYNAEEDQNVMLDGTSTAGTWGFTVANYPTASDSALSYNGGTGEWKMNDLGTFTLPERVEAIAFWFGQSNRDGSTDNWLFPDFRIDWSYTGDNGTVKSASSGTNVKVYFFSDDGEVYTNLRGSNGYNLWHFSKPTSFKQGFVVIPVGIYKEGAAIAGKNVKFSLALQNLREYQQTSPEADIIQTGITFGNRNIYFDNFCTISDLNMFLSSLEDTSYSVTDDPIYVCDEADAENKTFTNSQFGSVYSYTLSGDQGLSYNLRDTGSGLYGMSLKFTSPESTSYDVSNYLKVINNSIEASVYYRLMKESADGVQVQIWPENDGEWHQLNADPSNYNPVSPLELSNIYLEKGEKLRFEAYADVMSESGGEVNIKFVNTFLAPVTTISTSKGTVTEYPAINYMDCFHTTGSFTGGRYAAGAGRWNFSAMDLTDYSIIPLTDYNEGWGRMTYANVSGEVGFYTDISGTNVTLKTQTNSSAGVRMDFTSTQNGVAVISMKNEPTSGSAPANLRILRNEEQIYPVGSAWTQEAGQFSVSCDIADGDIISIQQYCTGGQTMNGVPTVEVYTGNTANLAGTSYYSALRERPWKNEAYNGEWKQESGTWIFNLYDDGIKTGDSFSSDDGGLVYNSEMGTGDGYRFEDKELLFDISEAGRGLSMTFNVPLTGFYDVGYALKILEGNGKISYRIRNGDTQLYPESGWSSVDPENPASECFELSLSAGTELTIDTYAADLFEPITLSMGDPTIIYNNEFRLNENGKCAVYNAFTFLNQEDGYAGPVTLDNKRFVYEIVNGHTTETLTYSDASTGKFTVSQTSQAGYQITDSGITMLLPDSGAGKVTFTSPRGGYANIAAVASSADNSEFTVTIEKNGERIYSETSAEHSIDVYAGIEEGDVIVVTASGSGEIKWSVLGISLDGVYDNENDPSASVFTASLVLPYGDDKYTGKYNADEKIWNFKTYYPETDTVKNVDFYDSEDNKHLFEEKSGVGYYFENKLLLGDLKETDSGSTGLSLEFIAPSDNTFEFFSGLQIVSPDGSEADVYVRITKNGETVWPAEGGWKKTENAAVDQDIIIPMQYLELVEGDGVALQIYAENIASADKTVKVALAAPRFRVHDVVQGNTDFTAYVYSAGVQRPFIGMDYTGSYYHSEGMWNFEFLDFFPDGEKTDTPVAVIGDDFSVNKLTSDLGNTGANYQIGDSSTTVVSYAEVDSSGNRVQTTGQSIRFVSPLDGEVEIVGTPTVSSLVSGQKAYFRILHNGEAVWPAEGGWEELDSENTRSGFAGQKITIAENDEICYQFYTDADDQAILAMSNKRATATFKLNPAVVYYEYISETKTSFKFLTDITTGLQLSPYWKAEYKMSRENDQWLQLEKYHASWKFWLDSTESMGWSTEYTQAWIKNGFGETVRPVLSATYTAHATGYINISNISLAVSNNVVRFPASVRITQNGQKIWPENEEWALVDLENKPVISDLKFAITEDDKIRFEVSPAEPMEVGAADLRIDISPQFTYTKYDEVYSKDNDIFGMLDKETYNYFKSLASAQFDTNPESTMKQSADFLAALAQRNKNWLEKISGSSQENSGSTSSSETITIVKPGTPDQYIPGTDSKIIKRRKKVVTTLTGGFPVWGIILIVVGSVLVGGTTVFLVVFIRKKKKRKAKGES